MSDRIRASLGPLLRWETGLALVVVIIGIAAASVSSEFFTSNNNFKLGLVYREGAASAYTGPTGAGTNAVAARDSATAGEHDEWDR